MSHLNNYDNYIRLSVDMLVIHIIVGLTASVLSVFAVDKLAEETLEHNGTCVWLLLNPHCYLFFFAEVISKCLGAVQTHMQEEFKLNSIVENRKDFKY